MYSKNNKDMGSIFFKKMGLGLWMALLIAGLGSCGSNIAGVTIPARQEFVLGEAEAQGFRAELRNRSMQQIEVQAVDKESGVQTQGFGLAPGGVATVNISRSEKVLLKNPSGEDVLLRVKLNKAVQGMGYQPISQ